MTDTQRNFLSGAIGLSIALPILGLTLWIVESNMPKAAPGPIPSPVVARPQLAVESGPSDIPIESPSVASAPPSAVSDEEALRSTLQEVERLQRELESLPSRGYAHVQIGSNQHYVLQAMGSGVMLTSRMSGSGTVEVWEWQDSQGTYTIRFQDGVVTSKSFSPN